MPLHIIFVNKLIKYLLKKNVFLDFIINKLLFSIMSSLLII